jgi:ATP-dependent Clp protease ATP-binding subunit ClpC
VTLAFSDEARQVIDVAAAEARRRGQMIGSPHLLLGIVAVPASRGARALQMMGFVLDEVRHEVDATIAPVDGREAREADPPFSSRARSVIEAATREAEACGREQLGSQHLLLGIVAESDGRASRILRRVERRLAPA